MTPLIVPLVSPSFRIGVFELTEEDVRRRKAYLEIGPADEARLLALHPLLEPDAERIIERLYEYLERHERTRTLLATPGLVERLKPIQREYFAEITSGVYDLRYCEKRLRMGQVHFWLGLAPELYLGAFSRYFQILIETLGERLGGDAATLVPALVSLRKVFSLDVGLGLDAYHHTARATRQQLTELILDDMLDPLAGMTAALEAVRDRDAPAEEGRVRLLEALQRGQELRGMILAALHANRTESGRHAALATLATPSSPTA